MALLSASLSSPSSPSLLQPTPPLCEFAVMGCSVQSQCGLSSGNVLAVVMMLLRCDVWLLQMSTSESPPGLPIELALLSSKALDEIIRCILY
jgi:hypothetical protein